MFWLKTLKITGLMFLQISVGTIASQNYPDYATTAGIVLFVIFVFLYHMVFRGEL